MLKSKGFTLVELLVVLVVIGILVALILPNALRAIKEANTKECASNIRSIDTTIQMLYTETRTWAGDLAALAPYFSDGVAPTCPFGVAYTLDNASTQNVTADKSTHFATWPTTHN